MPVPDKQIISSLRLPTKVLPGLPVPVQPKTADRKQKKKSFNYAIGSRCIAGTEQTNPKITRVRSGFTIFINFIPKLIHTA